jgi:mannose-6-phosphate isomerase-like protein (cupin superfamily)
MPHVVRKVQDASMERITCGLMRKLTGIADSKNMDFAHVTIRAPTKRHFHKELTEVYFVLKGAINVDLDGKIEHLKKGQMVVIFPNTKHKAWKATKADAEILVVCSPPWSEADEILAEEPD